MMIARGTDGFEVTKNIAYPADIPVKAKILDFREIAPFSRQSRSEPPNRLRIR